MLLKVHFLCNYEEKKFIIYSKHQLKIKIKIYKDK